MVTKQSTALNKAYPSISSASSSSYGFYNERTGKFLPLGKVLSEAKEEEVMSCDCLMILPVDRRDDEAENEEEGAEREQKETNATTSNGESGGGRSKEGEGEGEVASVVVPPSSSALASASIPSSSSSEEGEGGIVIIVQHGKVGHRIVFTPGELSE